MLGVISPDPMITSNRGAFTTSRVWGAGAAGGSTTLAAMIEVRSAATAGLAVADVAALRKLLRAAFAPDEHGGFTEDDWRHALGGLHFLAFDKDSLVAHAAVVARELHIAGKPLNAGYVEAVATSPGHQRRGFGSTVMRAVDDYIAANFELGALGTSSHGFYERLGWHTWRGPTYVRTAHGLERSTAEDGYIMVLRTPSSPALDLEAPISCDWRPGDSW
jgi:aminoglycoside 2'-N-acetyltransferase I